jgi:N-acetylmuramoyl-L-alanine amidase
MIDIDAFAKSHRTPHPLAALEKHFTAKNEKLECSFVLGFPYIFANGKASTLPKPSFSKMTKYGRQSKRPYRIFEAALGKNTLRIR